MSFANGFIIHFLVVVVVGILIPASDASFNLFLKGDEMKKVFGLSKELYYVREGVLNEYALNFIVLVPDQVTELHFTWETLGQKPLPYTSSIETSDSLAMDKPTMNISSKGVIPTVPETFRLSLPCTGVRDSEVIVELGLNVTTYPKFKANDVTRIVLKRKKICFADPKLKSSRRGHPSSQKPKTKNLKSGGGGGGGGKGAVEATSSASEDSFMEEMIPTEEAVADNAGIIYIIVGCSLGLVIIVAALASAAYVRTKKGRITAESSGFLHVDTSGNCSSGSGCGSGTGTGTGCSGSGGGSIFVRPESPHHYSSVSPCPLSGSYTYSSFQPNIAHYTEISPPSSIETTTNSCKLAEMAIQRCKVRLQSVIMEGTFAKIYKGTVLGNDGSEERAVIKTVNDHSSPVQMALLLHEGLALVGCVHKHVYSVVGVAAEERVPPFVIYPDDGFRNLKRFLQRCRSGPGRPITAQEIVHMAIQIASGIAFLHRQNVFHRDVAARNCVVDDKLTVKVSDSALSKDLFPDDYHWMGEAESRPIKWMPPEAILMFNRGAVATDMWSYGVLLWELATLAQQPYEKTDPADMVAVLKMGYRLAQPINCPDELYESMKRCWTWDPDDRPKWTHVLPDLQSLHAQLAQYV